MRFLDNVLQDFIDRAPAEMARAKYSASARALGGPGPDGLPLVPAEEGHRLRKRRWPRPGTCRCSSTSRRKADEASMHAGRRSAGACPDAAEMGVMERFSCKLAIAPTASISIICGGTSACIEPIPANIYTHKTLSGSFAVKNPYLEKLLADEEQGFDQRLELDPRARRLGPAPRLPQPPRRRPSSRPASRSTSAGCSSSPPTARRTSTRRSRSTSSSRPTSTSGTCTCCTSRRGRGASSRSTTCAPSRCSAPGFAGGVEADNTADAPVIELAAQTDYEECLACQ